MSVIAFLKIIAMSRHSRKLFKYRSNPGLNKRMPNYSVKMGFGLHQGWAIEGAIGSFYKIDASYLSPHVNMSSRLEGATKAFGVPLLISGELQEIVTDKMKSYLRSIDVVLPKGSKELLKLYSPDIVFEDMAVDPPETHQLTKK